MLLESCFLLLLLSVRSSLLLHFIPALLALQKGTSYPPLQQQQQQQQQTGGLLLDQVRRQRADSPSVLMG